MNAIQTEFDIIVIGGGINGLTTAAYLAKTGLKVVVIERRDQVGTHAATEEWSYPGFRTSPHATSHRVGDSPCMLDLDLEKFGLELYPGRYDFSMCFANGKAIVPDAWNVNNAYKSIERFSKHDAMVFKDLYKALQPLQSQIWSNFIYAAPSLERWDKIAKEFSKLPHVPEDWWNMSAFELVDLLFEDEQIKAWKASIPHAITMPPNQKIIGPLGVLLTSGSSGAKQALGGSHQIPHALIRCIIHYGGKVLQSSDVEKIIIQDGEAKGIILGRNSSYPAKRIMARRAIVSDLSPVPTFLHLVGEDHLDKQVAWVLKYEFDYDNEGLFTSSFMTTELPNWKGNEFDPHMREVWTFLCGVENLDDFKKMIAQLESDQIPDPLTALGDDFILTLHDETAAPPGHHNVQFWLNVPYSLRKLGGPEKWDDVAPQVLEDSIEMVERYAPGFRKTIKHKVGISPLDIFRKNPSAILGSRHGGVVRPGQLYFDKPFLGCNAPRTPIKNLYICNGMWPWNNTILATGYIAALEVIKDLGVGRPSWWSHRPGEWFPMWTERNGKHSLVNRSFNS